MKSAIVAVVLGLIAYNIFPFSLFVGAAGGLLIGWNVLEQPAIVREYWDKVVAKIEDIRS